MNASSHLDSDQNPYAVFGQSVAAAEPNERATFLRKTYIHLLAAIYSFVALIWFAFTALPMDEWIPQAMQVPYFGLILLGGFILVSWIANKWAMSDTSIGLQYAGLVLYTVAEAIFMAPLLWIAKDYSINAGFDTINVLSAAAVVTLGLFALMTATVYVTGADFSWLRSILMIGGFAAFGAIILSVFMGFNLGIWFSVAMVIYACGSILYDTSNVLHHYRPTQHVAAALALFASVALLFWYVLRLLLAFSSSD